MQIFVSGASGKKGEKKSEGGQFDSKKWTLSFNVTLKGGLCTAILNLLPVESRTDTYY